MPIPDTSYSTLIENDKIKENWAKEQGFHIIRIGFMEKLGVEEILETQLRTLNPNRGDS